MTEEDTFARLKRLTFNQVHEIHWEPGTCVLHPWDKDPNYGGWTYMEYVLEVKRLSNILNEQYIY